jgi:hypothetical protein
MLSSFATKWPGHDRKVPLTFQFAIPFPDGSTGAPSTGNAWLGTDQPQSCIPFCQGIFALIVTVSISVSYRKCRDLRFCNENIDHSRSQLTNWSITEFAFFQKVFKAPLIANGVKSRLTLIISKVMTSGLRLRIDPGPAMSSYRFDILHNDLIVNSTNINALDDLFLRNDNVSIKIVTPDDLELKISRHPFL